MTPDTITVVHSPNGAFTAKTFRKNSTGRIDVVNFSAGREFLSLSIPVDGLDQLSAVLSELEALPTALVIRGDLVDPVMAGCSVHRTGSGDGSSFSGNFMTPSCGRQWVLIDVDDLILPPELRLNQSSLSKVLDWVAGQLPPELQGVSFHWQLSSSAGVFSDEIVSLHLWFWLNSPVPDKSLKAWAKAFNEGSKSLQIDKSLFQHVQAHYTAKPIFEGMADPFPVRSGLIEKSRHAATIVPPAIQQVSHSRPHQPTITKSVSGIFGFEAHLASIGDHPSGAGFRGALLSATASYVRSHGAENTDPEQLFQRLSDAVLVADSSAHSQDEIEERASRETIMPMIKSAMRKFDKPNKAASPHLISGVVPRTRSEHALPKAALTQVINDFFNF